MYKVFYITGVSGCGKTTVGELLARELGILFFDGDDFHPDSNKSKMSSGTPLTDQDRIPWLEEINAFVISSLKSNSLIVACSALKESYRSTLSKNIALGQIQWIHLQGSFDLILNRMSQRKNHFMPHNLLQSQFNTYEKPTTGLIIDISLDTNSIVQKTLKTMNQKSAIGVIGLGVMGTSLARNIADKGISLSIYNRHVKDKEEKIAEKSISSYKELNTTQPFDNIDDFLQSLSSPKIILLMVNAGAAVDAVLTQITPKLTKGDIIIDGGNSHYKDTESRAKNLLKSGIQFIGAGVSGGEQGALLGPSIMPSGEQEAYKLVSNIFNKIAARNNNGEVCCNYIGSGGAGHFVKMVHNGIEYAEMQLICEIYSHLRFDQHRSLAEIAEIFTLWNGGNDQSYLLEITIDILLKKDVDGQPLIDKILDQAGNKGTGSWTTIAACELGVPIPTITASLFARYQSAQKQVRIAYADDFPLSSNGSLIPFDSLRKLYFFCRILNHHQGFQLITSASDVHNWDIDISNLIQTWSGGCIIKSALLDNIRSSIKTTKDLLNVEMIQDFIYENLPEIINVHQILNKSTQPYQCINASVDYFKYMRTSDSNANLIQAQRDYFGAHTYHRKDDGGKISHHTDWL